MSTSPSNAAHKTADEEFVVTWAMPDRTLEGLLTSRVDVIGWRINHEETRLVDPQKFSYFMPLRFPFDASKAHIVSSKLKIFKNETKKKLREEYRTLGGRKDEKSQQLRELIVQYAKNLNFSSRIEFLPKNEFGDTVANLITPQYNTTGLHWLFSDILQMVHYNRPQIQAEEAVNFPWGLVKQKGGVVIPDPKRRVVDERYIFNSTILSDDSEAMNWQRQFAPDTIRALKEEELKAAYVSIAQKSKNEFDHRKVNGLTRKEMIREIDGFVNELKGESFDLKQLYSTRHGALNIGLYPFKSLFTQVNWPASEQKEWVSLIQVKDATQMMKIVEQKTQEWQPLFIVGHNIFSYDFRQAKRLHGSYAVGVDDEQVVQRGQIPNGFIRRFAVPGREATDTMAHSQHFIPTQDKTLDTTFEYHVQKSDPKDYTHAQLPEVSRKAKEGDEASLDGYVRYSNKDIFKPIEIFMQTMQEHFLLSRTTRSSFGRIDTVAKSRRAIEYWNRRHFEARQYYPDALERKTLTHDIGSKQFADFGSYAFGYQGVKIALKKINDRPVENKDQNLLSLDTGLAEQVCDPQDEESSQSANQVIFDLATKRGFFQASWVEFFPLSHVFRELLSTDPEVRKIYTVRDVAAKSDPKLWCRLSRELEAYASYPAFLTLIPTMTSDGLKDALCIRESEIDPKCGGNLLEYYVNRLQKVMTDFTQELVSTGIVNVKPPMYIVQTPGPLLESFAQGYALELSRGKVISGRRGRFAMNRNGMYLSPGIAAHKSNKGERCAFDKNCYRAFFENVLMKDDIRSALEYIGEKARQLATGEVLRDELHEEIVYSRELKRSHGDFSILSNAPHVVQARRQRAQKGDILRYEYNIADMQERFFGLTYRNPKNDELFTDPEPVLHDGGKVSEIVNWLIPIKDDELARRLTTELYAGRGTSSVIDGLVEIYNANKAAVR